MENNLQTLPSLRCQAHWQNAQSQRYDQILPKSLPTLPTPTQGQKDNAAKIEDRMTKDKNGQLVTAPKKNWRLGASYDSFAVEQTFVLRMNICGENRQLLVAANRYGQG